MSSAFPNDPNPYQPSGSSGGDPYQQPGAETKPFPGYCTVVFIMSIVFCCIRLLLVLLGIAGLVMIMNNPQAVEGGVTVTTAILEVASGAGMVFFGIVGNALMLAKKRLGFVFGWLLVVSVLGNIGSGLLQIGGLFEQFEPGTPEFVGGIIGLVGVLAIRLFILGAYVYGLVLFKKWADAVGI